MTIRTTPRSGFESKVTLYLKSSKITQHMFFIHISIDGHLGCFPVLAIVNNATVNMGVQVSL